VYQETIEKTKNKIGGNDTEGQRVFGFVEAGEVPRRLNNNKGSKDNCDACDGVPKLRGMIVGRWNQCVIDQ